MANESNFKKIARATGKTIEFLVRAVIALSLSAIAYLGFNSPNGQKIINDLLGKTSSTNTPNPLDQAQPPTETPQPGETPSPTNIPSTPETTATAIQTPLPEATKPVDRKTEWIKNWPDTAEKIAAMCGGNASDWQRNQEWPDSKLIAPSIGTADNPTGPILGISDYINREWRNINPEWRGPNQKKWPINASEAADYFFPGQNIDPRFIDPAWIDPITGQTTGWHLSEDLWKVDGGPADRTLMLRPCQVAEGYTAQSSLKPEDDRAWVAFGGPSNSGINGGIALPESLIKGQGMTIWQEGTDPQAIALRMGMWPKGPDRPHYIGPNGEQLGPDAINFTPIYNAPGYEIIGSVQRSVVQQINDVALPPKIVSNPQTGQIRFEAVGSIATRPSFASTIPSSVKNPWRGMSQSRGNFSGNGRI